MAGELMLLDDDLIRRASAIGEQLSRRRLMLVTSESCTGGLAAAAITSIPGSSQWFERGFVTYSNRSKQELLGVRETTLETHGAVSEAVALEMAQGALQHSHAQVSLAVSGLAGPGGGGRDKPVGMVCFAWAGQGMTARACTRHFGGDRYQVRRQAVLVALQGVVDFFDAPLI